MDILREKWTGGTVDQLGSVECPGQDGTGGAAVSNSITLVTLYEIMSQLQGNEGMSVGCKATWHILLRPREIRSGWGWVRGNAHKAGDGMAGTQSPIESARPVNWKAACATHV